MKRVNFTLLICLLNILQLCCDALIQDITWCSLPKCKIKENHTICKWGIICPPDQTCETNVNFNKQMKDYIMELHNKKRNIIALGEDEQVPEKVRKAADMNVLQWHVHLEYVARCHSRQCDFNHDECRVVPDFDRVGQNIYTKSFTNKDPDHVDTKSIIDQGVEGWYNEIKHATEDIYNQWDKTSESSGHYTQLIWAKTTHIGCGLSQTRNHKKLTFYLVCNYGLQGNIKQKPIYSVGEPCSKCPEDKECNPQFKGLCGTIEAYAFKCPCEENQEGENGD
ncbi:scoloptoxin SSD976 [Dendroctonus ponderosae]